MSALSYLSPKTVVKASGIHGRGLFARDSNHSCEPNIGIQGQELQRKYGDYMSWYLLRRIRERS